MTTDFKFYSLLDKIKHKETLDFLQHNQTMITIKVNNKFHKTRILAAKSNQEFLIFRFNFEKYENDPVICSFEINAEKYFFSSFLKTSQSDILLTIPNEVFQLQRRNDFRVMVPAGHPYQCTVCEINGTTLKMDAELRDLSLGGCQIVLPKTNLNIQRDMELGFDLKMNNFEREKIFCRIRHIDHLQKTSKIQIGLSFGNSAADFLTDLQGLLVQLDRIHRGKTYE